MSELHNDIAACRLCAARFAATKTAHRPRPVVWFRKGAPIVVAGQAPGLRVHESGKPFDDRSGDRLRDWLGIDAATFYDQRKLAIIPMAFCFPGYDSAGSDLAPPKICASTWRDKVMETFTDTPLTLLIGGYAQSWHLGGRMGVGDRCKAWADHAPRVFPLPHPSWRNTGWLKNNPWFETDVLPALRARVQEVLT